MTEHGKTDTGKSASHSAWDTSKNETRSENYPYLGPGKTAIRKPRTLPFPRGAQTGETVEHAINQKRRTLHHLPPDPECDAGTWLTAFFLAVSCRDENRVTSLCRVTPAFRKEAREKRGGAYDEYVYPFIAALQHFVLNQPTLGGNLLRTMDLSRPENSSVSSPENLDHLVFPAIDCFYRLAEQNTEKFDEAMEQGIRLFRTYYTANEERSKDTADAVPLRLLGVACMTYDLAQVVPGFNPDLESRYLPEYILERPRYGEIEL